MERWITNAIKNMMRLGKNQDAIVIYFVQDYQAKWFGSQEAFARNRQQPASWKIQKCIRICKLIDFIQQILIFALDSSMISEFPSSSRKHTGRSWSRKMIQNLVIFAFPSVFTPTAQTTGGGMQKSSKAMQLAHDGHGYQQSAQVMLDFINKCVQDFRSTLHPDAPLFH